MDGRPQVDMISSGAFGGLRQDEEQSAWPLAQLRNGSGLDFFVVPPVDRFPGQAGPFFRLGYPDDPVGRFTLRQLSAQCGTRIKFRLTGHVCPLPDWFPRSYDSSLPRTIVPRAIVLTGTRLMAMSKPAMRWLGRDWVADRYPGCMSSLAAHP